MNSEKFQELCVMKDLNQSKKYIWYDSGDACDDAWISCWEIYKNIE